MNNNISYGSVAKTPYEVSQTAEPASVRIPRERAFSLLHDILGKLCPPSSARTCYLAFGSVARELLNPKGKREFSDIDILTIKPLDTAIQEVHRALEAVGIKHYDDSNGNFLLHVEGACFQLQLVDPVDGKDAFPGGFIGFKDSEFDASRCVQWPQAENGPPIPCVPQQFLDTWGNAFYYLGDPKTDPLFIQRDVYVSEFKP